MSAFLEACHLIPVYRKSDAAQDMGKNRETFSRAVEVLHRGMGVVIFPEGVSEGKRKLEELKTGAARIAFQAEDSKDFSLGLRIQPVGITYTDLDLFRGSVTVLFGETISVGEFRAAYELDAQQAVRELTDRIDERLRALTVDIAARDHEVLVERIAKLYAARGIGPDDFTRMSEIARHVERLAPQLGEERVTIERKLDLYADLSEAFGLEADTPLEAKSDRWLLAISPLIFLGALLHWPPYWFTGFLARKLSKHEASLGSLKFSLGLFVFLGWYLVIGVVLSLSVGLVCGLLGMAVAVLLGYLANRELSRVTVAVISRLWPGRKKPTAILQLLQEDLFQTLERYRNSAQ